MSDRLPIRLPAALLHDDLWKPAQALTHARYIHDHLRRAHTRLAIIIELENRDKELFKANTVATISHILNDLEKVPITESDQICARLLLNFLPYLTHEEQEKQIENAVTITHKIKTPIWRARLLANVVSRITDPDKQLSAVRELVNTCKKLDHNELSDDYPYVWYIYKDIAHHLPINVLDQAIEEVKKEVKYIHPKDERDEQHRLDLFLNQL